MENSQSIEKSTINFKFMNTSEEEVKQPTTQTMKIKEEFDIINECEFHSVITIENDPILYKKKPIINKHVDNKNFSVQFMNTSEEEVKQPTTQTMKIKEEFDIKNDPILYKKPTSNQSVDNENFPVQFMSTSKEEEIKQPITKTIKIKEEYDVMNGCKFHSIITIENDPILYKKTKLRRKKYTCHNCGNTFFRKSKLKRHMRKHTKRKVCNENCPLQFTSTSEAKNKQTNIQAIETKKETDSLNSCDFMQLSHVNQHKPIYTQPELFTCGICKSSFSRSSTLKRHNLVHTGVKPYKCKVCQKSFPHKLNLEVHTRTHTGEKPYACDVCKKSFSQLISLKRHILIHTKEKPYECFVCKESFRHKSSLVLHIRVHTGEKPFECKVCQKSFSLKSNLVVHTRIHTGEKSYTCNVCEKSFTQSPHLNRHKLIHTKKKL